jgi:A/G-specific adenine glycosylase
MFTSVRLVYLFLQGKNELIYSIIILIMADFSRIILNWYNDNGRDLPWRHTKDAYHIWISEIILQQTRIDQGYDYYLRFAEHFPDLKSLADAEEDEVLRYWQGLGYYSRARNMHEAARSMNGTFPSSYSDIIALKGVGEYTAAAICSIAYNEPIAVVDGNVYRVLSRYFGIETPIDSTRGKKSFKELAQSLLDKEHPGLYNQAIMDFGALQCIPGNPDCNTCPLSDSCHALQEHRINSLPVKQHHTRIRDRYFNYIYVHTRTNILIHKRTASDIWKNLYELPLIETPQAIEMDELIQTPEFKSMLTFSDKPVLSQIYSTKHILTHRIIHAVFYELQISSTEIVKHHNKFICIPTAERDRYAMPQLIQRFFEKEE